MSEREDEGMRERRGGDEVTDGLDHRSACRAGSGLAWLVAVLLLGSAWLPLYASAQGGEEAAEVAAEEATEEATTADVLFEYMSGSFSSAEQAAADSSYYDIRLHMKPIWPDRTDGMWLYVEQAVAQAQDRPYRQRVYHVTEDSDGRFRSTVYELASPLRFTGVWREALPLRSLNPDSLKLRDGCDIVLEPVSEGFAGRTGDRTCSSSLRGASYATSEVEVFEDRLISWDRGFDAEGQQVWGAEAGGYVFVKEAPLRADEVVVED